MSWWNPLSWGRGGSLELPEAAPRGKQLQTFSSRRPRRVIGIEGREGHPGRALTMSSLVSAHDRAECGYPSLLFDTLRDRLKADAHMRSHVSHRRDDVTRNLQVLAGGDAEVDKLAADELSRRLRLADGFRNSLRQHALVFWNGFALTEVSWAFDNGLFFPSLFDTPNQRRFIFDANDMPLLPTERASNGEPLRPGAWWYSQRGGDRPAVAGDGFTACIWSHFKTLSVSDWLKLSDRFGIPFVYGSFTSVGEEEEDAASDDDIEKLELAVEKLGKDRWAVFSRAAEIKVVETLRSGGGKSEIHSAIMAACNDEISKLIAGSTTVAQTSGSTGSFAQSRVHADRSFNLYLSDAEALADSLECYLGRAFVLFNASRFPGAMPPRFKFHLVQDQSPLSRATVFDVALNKLGMTLSMDQVRTELQIKPALGEVLEPRILEAAQASGTEDNGEATEA